MDDDGLPWRHGLIAGAVAWGAGFGVTLVLTVLQIGLFTAVGDPLLTLLQAIVFFLGMHLWPLLFGGAGIGIGLGPVLFTPVPMTLLFAAGYRVATVRGVHWNREAYLSGATVGAGYTLVTVLSLLVFAVLTGSGLSAVSVYIIVLGFTGAVVPLLAGGFGGIIAGR